MVATAGGLFGGVGKMSWLEVYSWGAAAFFVAFVNDDELSPIGATAFAAVWPALALYFVYAVAWEVQHRTRVWWQSRGQS